MMKIEELYFLCLKKANRHLTTFLEEKIQIVYGQEIKFDDTRVPQGICETCRAALRKCYKGHQVELPQIYHFERINVKTPTRGNPQTVISCLLCSMFKHQKWQEVWKCNS